VNPVHFANAADFRAWLEQHHATTSELVIAFYKKASGKPGLSYKEAVDEALCFGWIDGIVRRLDDERFSHRFTPRKRGSIWSNVNVAHVKRLTEAGRMHPAGVAAFAARVAKKTGIYSFEQKASPTWPTAYRKLFQADAAAWAFFTRQPPGYQRNAMLWVLSAKQETTRTRRLARLMALSKAGRRRN
jgi:uncharacterized protein YdeI (YjbR/CyaY-like superfamily)